MEFRSVFGPVHSSRLGQSLGIDLLGDRICSFDCLYCESGRTSIQTLKRRAYVPASRVLEEVRAWSEANRVETLDHITLGGPGEPCLNSDLAEIVRGIKQLAPDIPLAVLTNASLLGDFQVRSALGSCDVILPSLDSLVPEEFHRLNRPCPGLDPLQIAEEMIDYRSGYPGKLYLEILLVHGVNDSQANLERMQRFCTQLDPERVDVMTMSRPGAYLQKGRVSDRVLKQWRDTLGAFTGHIAGESAVLKDTADLGPEVEDMIVRSVSRRPQRADQLARGLSLDRTQVEACVQQLVQKKRLKAVNIQDEVFFSSS